MSWPFIIKGGYPFLSQYEMLAPNLLRASTKILIGLSFILFDPVITNCLLVFIDNKAVKKRIAVPAW